MEHGQEDAVSTAQPTSRFKAKVPCPASTATLPPGYPCFFFGYTLLTISLCAFTLLTAMSTQPAHGCCGCWWDGCSLHWVFSRSSQAQHPPGLWVGVWARYWLEAAERDALTIALECLGRHGERHVQPLDATSLPRVQLSLRGTCSATFSPPTERIAQPFQASNCPCNLVCLSTHSVTATS